MRHACRSILKRPAMSAIVVVTLALGLGANAAVFEMIDALVLRPFTMPDADRITLLAYSRAEDIYPSGVGVARRLPRHEAAAARRLRAARGVASSGTPTWSARTNPRTCRAFSCRQISSPCSASSRSPGATSSPRRKRADNIAASCSDTACGSAASRPTRRSSAARSRSTARRTKSSASRRRASISRWGRSSGRRCRSRPRPRRTAGPST